MPEDEMVQSNKTGHVTPPETARLHVTYPQRSHETRTETDLCNDFLSRALPFPGSKATPRYGHVMPPIGWESLLRNKQSVAAGPCMLKWPA